MKFRRWLYGAEGHPSKLSSKQEKVCGRLQERVWTPIFQRPVGVYMESQYLTLPCAKSIKSEISQQKCFSLTKLNIKNIWGKYGKEYVTRDAGAAEALYQVRTKNMWWIDMISLIHRMGRGQNLCCRFAIFDILVTLYTDSHFANKHFQSRVSVYLWLFIKGMWKKSL